METDLDGKRADKVKRNAAIRTLLDFCRYCCCR